MAADSAEDTDVPQEAVGGDPEMCLPASFDKESYGAVDGSSCQKAGTIAEDEGTSYRQHKLLPSSPDGRHPCLDVVRMVCIWLVVVDHAGTAFGHWNVMYVQAWVLQYLYMICGISFGLTSKPLCGVLLRLTGISILGIFCNWTAWAILGRDWRHEIGNVVFQFWFVAGLMIFLVLLAPLKANMQRVVQRLQAGVSALHDDDYWRTQNLPTTLIVVGGGYYALTLLVQHGVIPLLQTHSAAGLANLVNSKLGAAAEFWGLPTTVPEAEVFIQDMLTYMQLSASNVYLVFVFPCLSVRVELVGWLVILNTYAHKMVCYRDAQARLLTGFDCTLLGLVCFYYGLSHRQLIGSYFVRYWFAFLFLCALLWPPGASGRFDEHPPTDLGTRARDNGLEMLFIVFFLTAVERAVDDKIFRVDGLDWLNNWALLLFLVHMAVHMLLPAPFNWLVFFAMGIPFYIYRKRDAGKSAAAAALAAECGGNA